MINFLSPPSTFQLSSEPNPSLTMPYDNAHSEEISCWSFKLWYLLCLLDNLWFTFMELVQKISFHKNRFGNPTSASIYFLLKSGYVRLLVSVGARIPIGWEHSEYARIEVWYSLFIPYLLAFKIFGTALWKQWVPFVVLYCVLCSVNVSIGKSLFVI